jgi:hypothetical protein
MPIQPTLRRPNVMRTSDARRVPRLPRATVGQCFDIEVSRVTDGWIIRIPEIGGVTRVSRRAAVELGARKCIANRTGIPIGYVAIYVSRESD